jgi:hypothetical protein
MAIFINDKVKRHCLDCFVSRAPGVLVYFYIFLVCSKFSIQGKLYCNFLCSDPYVFGAPPIHILTILKLLSDIPTLKRLII